MSILRQIRVFVKSHLEVPHHTVLSVVIGIGVAAVTLLVMAAFDGGLFGQEAEAGARRNGRINRADSEMEMPVIEMI